MSLRLRVALALAGLAAVCSAAAAVSSYVVTTNRINLEVDTTLQSYVARFADPDGDLARALCDPGVEHPAGRGPADDLANGVQGLPGVTVQCVAPTGRIITSLGPSGVPVSAKDAVPSSVVTRPQTEQLGGVEFRVVRLPSPTGDTIRISRNLQETDEILDSVRNRLLGIGLVIALVAGVVGLVFAKRTIRPITQLTQAAEAIAGSGDLTVMLPEPRSDEIGRLTRAFGAMIDALRTSKDQQQRLVQDASHELRTPLASLRTNIDTLRRYQLLEGAQREHLLNDLDSELRELSTVVDELLAFATDRLDDEPAQSVDLTAITTAVAERIARRSGREIPVSGASPDVVAKPYLLARAVTNLVENAIKFSPDGPVRITISDHCVQISDSGTGIDAADMKMIFDRFYRAPAARSLPGSGLGLAIVRQIMEGTGGSVSVANDPAGGAVFTLSFARAQPD